MEIKQHTSKLLMGQRKKKSQESIRQWSSGLGGLLDNRSELTK